MKTFLTMFAAVLCAIVVAAVGFSYLQKLHSWEAEQTKELAALASFEAFKAEEKKRLNELPPSTPSDFGVAGYVQQDIQMIEAQISDKQADLINLYLLKPLPLSAKESADLHRWKLERAAYRPNN